MKKYLICLFFCILFSSFIYANQFNWQKNYLDNNFTNQIESIFEETLSSTLLPFNNVDDIISNEFTISVEVLSYNLNLFIFEGELFYNNNSIPLSIEYNEENQEVVLTRFREILSNTLRYDLGILINKEDITRLIYSNKINGIKIINNEIQKGDFVYIISSNNDKSLAIVDSIYDEYGTLDFLYNPTDLINSSIIKGPNNEFNLGFSYDYQTELFSVNVDYFILKPISDLISNTYFGMSFSYYKNFIDFSDELSTNLSLKIEVPFSKLSDKVKILNNSSIYSKSKLGITFLESLNLHSILEIGFKQYFANNINLSFALKNDSYKNSFNNVIVSCGLLF